MSYPIEFLEDFATFKKGDKTDKLSGDIVASLRNRGIAKDSKVVKKKKVLDAKAIEVKEPRVVKAKKTKAKPKKG